MTKFLAISEDSNLGLFSNDNFVSVDGNFNGSSAVTFLRGGVLEIDGIDTSFLVVLGNTNNRVILARSQIIKRSAILFYFHVIF